MPLSRKHSAGERHRAMMPWDAGSARSGARRLPNLETQITSAAERELRRLFLFSPYPGCQCPHYLTSRWWPCARAG